MKKISKLIGSIVLLLCIAVSLFAANYRYNLFGTTKHKTIHVSIDDVILVFEDLTKNENEYNSIFDNYTLRYLKKLHDEYNICFSMYCWYEKDGFNLSNATRKFKSEFEDNSDWLKFNYHSYDANQNLSNVDYELFVEQYDAFRDAIQLIVGESSWDSFTRLHLFSGSQDCLNYMYSKGTLGFYCSDDERISYSLSSTEIDRINVGRIYYDDFTGITYKKTDLRLDNLDNPFSILVDFKWSNMNTEIFTHEWLISSPKGSSIWKLKEVCEYSRYYNASFCY